MRGVRDLSSTDFHGLPPQTVALLAHLQQLDAQADVLAERDRQLGVQHELIQRKDREIALRDARIEKITFELARLKRWKFGVRTEAMSAEQRQLFAETLAEDEADLQAQLERLRAEARPMSARSRRRLHVAPGARHYRPTCAASSTATSPRTPRARPKRGGGAAAAP